MQLRPSQRVNINDSVTRHSLTVDWVARASEGRVDLEEITFMIVGEVPVLGEPVTLPPRFPGGRVRPGDRIPPDVLYPSRKRQARKKTRKKK